MQFLGYVLQHGDPPHFLWGKNLQCVKKNIAFQYKIVQFRLVLVSAKSYGQILSFSFSFSIGPKPKRWFWSYTNPKASKRVDWKSKPPQLCNNIHKYTNYLLIILVILFFYFQNLSPLITIEVMKMKCTLSMKCHQTRLHDSTYP